VTLKDPPSNLFRHDLVRPDVTRVVHVRDWVRADPSFVYIGRAGHGQDGYFGNPVARGRPCPECGRVHQAGGETLGCYRIYLERRLAADPEFRARVAQLCGKSLTCFCVPGPCHGDILAEHADRLSLEAPNG
jgi:hypothetical protein